MTTRWLITKLLWQWWRAAMYGSETTRFMMSRAIKEATPELLRRAERELEFLEQRKPQ